MLNRNIEHDLIKEVKDNLIKSIQTKAEKLLNPDNYHLSVAAKTRLRWLYLLYYEKQGNVTKAANKVGISRQSRKIKRKEQIEALMNFINAKLNKNKGLNEAKLQLINCELCSVA